MNRAVLWDMDGTSSTLPNILGSVAQHNVPQGSPITYEQCRATFGQRNNSILRLCLGEKATSELILRIDDTKEALYRQHVRQQGISPVPGALQWIHLLQRSGWGQAIASAARASSSFFSSAFLQ